MPTFNGAVAANADDAEEKADGSGFSSTGTLLTCTASSISESTRSLVGLRFSNVTIPAGATIISSKLALKIHNTSASDDPDLFIYANDVDNAANFSDEADVISRARTTANVAWDDGNIGQDVVRNSPDFKAVVQEVINRASWASGNALCIILVGRESLTGSLIIEAYDNAGTTPAAIEIVYNLASTSDIQIAVLIPMFVVDIFDADIFHVGAGAGAGLTSGLLFEPTKLVQGRLAA